MMRSFTVKECGSLDTITSAEKHDQVERLGLKHQGSGNPFSRAAIGFAPRACGKALRQDRARVCYAGSRERAVRNPSRGVVHSPAKSAAARSKTPLSPSKTATAPAFLGEPLSPLSASVSSFRKAEGWAEPAGESPPVRPLARLAHVDGPTLKIAPVELGDGSRCFPIGSHL